MRLAFLHARQHPELAELMLASVRRVMPLMRCVHLTDEETTPLPGCSVRRLPWDGSDPMRLRLRHLCEMGDEELIVIDTDCIVQQDLRAVFAFRFDVALTQRDGPIWDSLGTDITITMPFNCGVMFSRDAAFWAACLAWLEAQPDQGWYADQLAVAQVVRGNAFKVLRLHCHNFNRTPNSVNENVEDAYVVHYKGKRKLWMMERYGRNLANVA